MDSTEVGPRRAVLAGLGAMLAAPALVADHLDAPNSVATGDGELLRDFIRLRTAPDLSPVIWVYSGVLVVKPDAELARPVARIAGVSRSRATSRADGSWLWELDEAGYYCDLSSGLPVAELVNPFTGVTVRTKHYRSPQSLVFSRTGIVPANALPSDIEFRGEITRLAEVAGTVALTEDLYVKVSGRPASDGRPARSARLAASLATFTTLRRNLGLPEASWVDCQFNYTTLNSVAEWLGFAERGGVQDMRIVGVKCRIDQRDVVPDWLRFRVNAEHPDLLT